jgi:hypothetical protein
MVCEWFGLKTTLMVFSGLTSKLAAMVFSDLTSKPVEMGFPVCASKLTASIW